MARQSYSTSKISVWWDIENCHVPRNVDPHCIAQNLRLALHHANLNGPITIDAFGDTRNLDHKMMEALSSTGITISHIPSGNKDAADKAILVAMLFWALDNSPPAHFLLISGDGDFANALHRLRLKGYNILLARPDQPVKPALLGAATSIWYWTDVAKGQIQVPEEMEQSFEESSGRFSSNKVRNNDFVKADPSRQRSLPNNSGEHSTFCSRPSAAFKDEGVLSPNQGTAPLREVEGQNITSFNAYSHHDKNQRNNVSFDERGSLKCQRETPQEVRPDSHATDWGTSTCNPREDMQCSGQDLGNKLEKKLQADENWKSKLVSHTPIASSAKQVEFPSSKQPGNLGHRPMRPGDEKTGDKQKSLLGSSNKISDHAKATATTVPMPTVVDYMPSLSQDAIRAYNGSISKLRSTFEILKLDGLLPTHGHLQDCLCYWDKQHGKVNLQQVLDQAVHWQHIVKVLAGEAASPYFLPCNTQLWKCFNIHDMVYAFSDELWRGFYQVLCCSKNWQFFVHSRSMYEAAHRLKGNGHSGIRDLAIGEIILFLNQAIQNRKWLNLEITPTFVLSIKWQVIMEQGGLVQIKTATLQDAKDDGGFVANGHTEVISLYDTSTKLVIFEKLRNWLLETSHTRPDYDISLVPKDFYNATGIYLDISKLGFAKLQGLIEEFDDVVTIKLVRKGLKILCPADKGNMRKLPSFETFQDSRPQRARSTCQNNVVKKTAVTTAFAPPFQDKEKQGCCSQFSQTLGVSQATYQKHPVPDGVSPNYPPKSAALDHQTSACLVPASKDVAQHAHPASSIGLLSWNAGGLQISSVKASPNHPSLKKLRSWLRQLPSLNDGYDLSLIKKDFQKSTGIILDPVSLGYPKVKDILKEFRSDFHLESPRSGLWLVYHNNKGMQGSKSNADNSVHHLARESSGHAMISKADSSAQGSHGQVGEETPFKPAQKSAGTKKSGLQWKELHPSAGVGDGEM